EVTAPLLIHPQRSIAGLLVILARCRHRLSLLVRSEPPVDPGRFTFADAAAFNLRATAGRDPYDRALTDLVGELSMRSEDFRERWASQDVRQYRTGTQRFRHPLVGE